MHIDWKATSAFQRSLPLVKRSTGATRTGKSSHFPLDNINNIVYIFPVNSKEFKRWLTQQGATFLPVKART